MERVSRVNWSEKIGTLCSAFVCIVAMSGISVADGSKTFKPAVQDVQSASPWYVSVFSGVSIIDGDVDFTNGTTTVSTDFDSGLHLGGAIGIKWLRAGNGNITPRTELEVSYSEHDVDTLDFSGNGAGNEIVVGGSQISALSIFGNLFFDFNTGGRITPYIGGGLGVKIVNHDIIYNAAGVNLNDDDQGEFAWHVTGGASFQLTERARGFIDIGYRQAQDVGSVRRAGSTVLVGAGGGRFEDDIGEIVVRSGLSVPF